MVQKNNTETQYPAWRFKLGLAVLITGFLSPLLIPVVTAFNLSSEWKTLIIGALAVGIPEIFTLVAVAIMGKAGFNKIKAFIFGVLKKHSPPDKVSRTRYRIGLIMFCIPIIFGWSAPYFTSIIPGYESYRLTVDITLDALFILSFFILGGDFWDKLRSLFVHNA